MGGAVSSGRDNNELIDNLVSSNYIRSRDVERVFRALDRADYMTREARDQAYKDLAWRHGPLHLSAPCIYSEVMEGLELSPGLSFLNVGSGTGYLSTLVGLILGSSGISHGVEVHPVVVEYATKRLSQFIENSPVLDEFDFCEPKYYLGNGLCIAPLAAPYDRVYCGAGCPDEYQNYFKQLIKVGGILVMPLNDNLVQVKRVGESEWTSRSVLNVSFATLRVPTKEEATDLLRLDEQCPARLQTLCRGLVRSLLRGGVWRRHPELRAPPPRPPPAKKPCPRRICIPIEDESDVEGLNALHDLDRGGGAGEMNALLSLVLSMGPSRVAGALRFDAPSDDTLSDNEDPPPDAAPASASGSRSASRTDGTDTSSRADSSRSSWGQRPCRGMLTFELRDSTSRAPATPTEPAPSASETQSPPEPPTGIEACETRDTDQAADTGDRSDAPDKGDKPDSDARVTHEDNMRDARVKHEGDRSDARVTHEGDKSDARVTHEGNRSDARVTHEGDRSDSRVTHEGDRSDAHVTHEGNRSNARVTHEGDRSDADRLERERRDRSDKADRDSNKTRDRSATRRRRGGRSDDEQDDVPAEVEIYLGKMGGGEATTSREMEWDAEDEDDDDDDYEPEVDTEAEQAGIEADGEASLEAAPEPAAADKPPRQKLDSGIGEMTVSADSSPASTGYEAGSSRRSGQDSDLADTRPGRRRRQKRHFTRRSSESGASGSSGTSGTSDTSGSRRRHKRRASDGDDARRVRLSVLMKRSVKELPLPYALKKYVNLGRCFEF